MNTEKAVATATENCEVV